MAAVAASREAWSRAELAHLEACHDCAAEWQLVQATAALGTWLPVDPDRTAATVARRLGEAAAEDARRSRVWGRAMIIGLAAAAALLLVVMPRRTATRAPGVVMVAPAGTAVLQLAELDDAPASDLLVVLAGFEEAGSVAGTLDGDLDGLDSLSIAQTLRTWEES
jgi:hypothetical protein